MDSMQMKRVIVNMSTGGGRAEPGAGGGPTPGGGGGTGGAGGGERILGWSDGECFTLPQEAEIAKIRKGADGQKARFGTGERGGECMISLLPTANSAGYLNGLFQQERQIDDQGGGMEPVLLQISVEYVDSGTTVQCRDGGFLKGPLGISGGDGDFGNLKWTMEFEDIEWDTSGSSAGNPAPPGPGRLGGGGGGGGGGGEELTP